MKSTLAILFVFGLQLALLAQQLSTKIERDQMLIGELNSLIIEHNGTLKQSDLQEIKSIKGTPSGRQEETKKFDLEVYAVEYSENEIKILFTVWDSSLVIVPPFALNKNGEISSQATMFRVNYPQVDESGEILDIYEITVVEDAFMKFLEDYWWISLALVVIVFILGLFLIIRIKESKTEENIVNQLSPDEKALLELNQLMQQKLFSPEHQKLHFTEFSDILRRYVGLHYGFVTFEKTTFEIIEHLRKKRVETTYVVELESLLMLSDMVKFSKATVEEYEIESSSQKAISFIEDTTKKRKSDTLTEKGDAHA